VVTTQETPNSFGLATAGTAGTDVVVDEMKVPLRPPRVVRRPVVVQATEPSLRVVILRR
jgi:hypothetical protein